MSNVRRLYERFRHLIHEAAKFGIVGAIGFIVTDGGTNLIRTEIPQFGWLKANVIATLAATCVTFLGSRYWTFRHRERTGMGREWVLFFVLNGVGLGIQLACLGFTNYALGLTSRLPSNIALFLGIALGTLFRFWSYRKWVWTAPDASAVPPDPAAVAAAADEPQGQSLSSAGPPAEKIASPVALSQTGGSVGDDAGHSR